ncbi:MAG: hypothetical protein M1469_08335 [Bacteroidetes bacterium]|nr:hypothetical protein [Bacteroidota bacterium]
MQKREGKLGYFAKQARNLFGRDIAQILLLHVSSLNSNYVDSLAVMFRKHNYTFVSMDRVFEDDGYRSGITVYGDWGISWGDRWALSQGKSGAFFRDEPVTPAYIKKLSE